MTAAKQAGAVEQVLDAVSTLSAAELAAKGGEYVTAVLSAGGAEQLVAAANSLSPAKLLRQATHIFDSQMAIASASAGADVTGHMCTPQAIRWWLVTS
jgi:hypothetical protein